MGGRIAGAPAPTSRPSPPWKKPNLWLCVRGFRLDIYGTEGRLSVESPNMVQYSPASVYGAQGSGALQELPVPPRLHEVTHLPADSQALQVAQLLRQFIQSVYTGTVFHPHFGDAVSLHRTLEAVMRSSSTGSWEVVT